MRPVSDFFTRGISPLVGSAVAPLKAKNPNPGPLVRCANVAGSEHSPFRIIPHLGQVSKDSSKPSNNQIWRIFHEDVSGFHFANDSCHFSPQSAPGPSDARALAGAADVLAWESPADDINPPSPRLAVEGSHVVPDWEAWQHSIPLPLQEHLAAVGLDFNGANRVMSEKDAAEDSSPASCK